MSRIDFEQELYNRFGQVKDFTLGMRIAKYFYEMGRNDAIGESAEWLDKNADSYTWYDEEEHDSGMTNEFIENFKKNVGYDRKRTIIG